MKILYMPILLLFYFTRTHYLRTYRMKREVKSSREGLDDCLTNCDDDNDGLNQR